jgi:hypothetical protein
LGNGHHTKDTTGGRLTWRPPVGISRGESRGAGYSAAATGGYGSVTSSMRLISA